MVKPIGRNEFDVDLIAFLATAPASLPPAEAKRLVGDRLREHGFYATILEPKKRCWRLNYAGDFHLDISPTIANPRCLNGGQLVPDRDLRGWHPTNPRGYRNLFHSRAELKPTLLRRKMDRQVEATVEPYPAQQTIKGILRRTVQLLKRHRDVHFLEIPGEVAPISIIITTLAMRAYEACVLRRPFADELEVLIETIRAMPASIERRLERGREEYAIWNETATGENFAERWNSERERALAFYAWHAKALRDFEALRDAVGEDTVARRLQEALGNGGVVRRVMADRTNDIASARGSGRLLVAPAVGLTLTPSAHAMPVPTNIFYGD